jgi:transcriptional/translational regulatory protein YebC/TACO1
LVENKETIQSLLAANVTDETDVDSEKLEQELANKNKLLLDKMAEIKKETDSLNNVVSELEKTKISASKKEIIAIDQQIVAVQKEASKTEFQQMHRLERSSKTLISKGITDGVG